MEKTQQGLKWQEPSGTFQAPITDRALRLGEGKILRQSQNSNPRLTMQPPVYHPYLRPCIREMVLSKTLVKTHGPIIAELLWEQQESDCEIRTD